MADGRRRTPKRRKAKNGKRVSPTVTYTALNVLEYAGITTSDAIERYALFVATDNINLIMKKEILQHDIRNLEQDIAEIEKEASNRVKSKEKRIKQYKDELESIENSLIDYLPTQSVNAQNAMDEVMQLIKQARIKANGRTFGVKKVPLEAIEEIAENNHIKLISLLAMIDDDVKKSWIENYKKI